MKTLIALFAVLMVIPCFARAADPFCAPQNINRNAQEIYKAMKAGGTNPQWAEMAVATFYGDSFRNGITTGGAKFDQNKLMAAHNFYSMGQKLTLKNPKTGQVVCVTVADTGAVTHLKRNRIDLSKRAFRASGYSLDVGRAVVDIEEGWSSACPAREEIAIAPKMRGWSKLGSRKTANADQ